MLFPSTGGEVGESHEGAQPGLCVAQDMSELSPSLSLRLGVILKNDL